MSDESKPTRQALAIPGRSAPGKVTGKLRTAIDRMIWHGDKRAAAAEAAGMADHSLRAALRKPHVLAHFRAELRALRESERPRNLHALCRVRDSSENGVAVVAASRALEGGAEAAERDLSHGPVKSHGFVIQVVSFTPEPAPPNPLVIEGNLPAKQQLSAEQASANLDDETDYKTGD